MGSGADLFVVCKHCGSEVSPYVTECPYCGNRVRRRAPKLPRPDDPPPRREAPIAARATGVRCGRGRRCTLVAAGAALYVLVHAEPQIYLKAAILGPLRGDWWRLLTRAVRLRQRWLCVRRAGHAGDLREPRRAQQRAGRRARCCSSGLRSRAGSSSSRSAAPPIAAGANGAALALLVAWAVPQLRRARAGELPAGDLIGAAAIGLLLFAVPAVVAEASWLAGVIGVVVGAPVGAGVSAFARDA